MLICNNCNTPNAVDSAFCKNCGAAIPEVDREAGKLKVNALVEEGNSLYTEGRIEEAMMLAVSAIEADPSNAHAYSLKGLCLEHNHEYGLALEAYEKSVSLNPDAALDKVKITLLRNKLLQTPLDAPEPNKRLIALRAVSAAALVLVLFGLIYAAAARLNPQPVASNSGKDTQGQQAVGFPTAMNGSNPGANLSGNQASGGQNNPNGNPGNPQSNPSGQTNSNPAPYQNQYGNPSLPTAPTGILPVPGDGSLAGPVGIQPINPGLTNPSQLATSPNSGGGGTVGNSVDPNPQVMSTKGGAPDSTAANDPKAGTKPPANPGIIHIEMGNSGSLPNQMGARGTDGQNESAALLRTAQSQYSTGDYGRALSTFQQLAKVSGGSGLVHQRIGQCNEKLGRNADAISAYKAAISAYQSNIDRGVNVGSSRLGLNTCKQALSLLGG